MAKKKKRTGRRKVSTAVKPRNWIAVHAHFRQGAGSHGDAKKQASRKACRGPAASSSPSPQGSAATN